MELGDIRRDGLAPEVGPQHPGATGGVKIETAIFNSCGPGGTACCARKIRLSTHGRQALLETDETAIRRTAERAAAILCAPGIVLRLRRGAEH